MLIIGLSVFLLIFMITTVVFGLQKNKLREDLEDCQFRLEGERSWLKDIYEQKRNVLYSIVESCPRCSRKIKKG